MPYTWGKKKIIARSSYRPSGPFRPFQDHVVSRAPANSSSSFVDFLKIPLNNDCSGGFEFDLALTSPESKYVLFVEMLGSR